MVKSWTLVMHISGLSYTKAAKSEKMTFEQPKSHGTRNVSAEPR